MNEPCPPIFPDLPVTLGVYTLTRRLGSHEHSDFYVATQSHVERRVALEVLRPGGSEEESELFQANARARVAARLPHVAQVLASAPSEEGYWYITQELPDGSTLASKEAAGGQLTPLQVCALIGAAAELYGACTAAGLAAGPLSADMIFLGKKEEFSFLSPVIAGEPSAEGTAAQMRGLADALAPVQPRNVPGQTRIATLIAWMRDGFEGRMLEWSAIASTASLIVEQLTPRQILSVEPPPTYDRGRDARADAKRRRYKMRRLAIVGGCLLVVVAMGAVGFLLSSKETTVLPAVRDGYIHFQVGGKDRYVSDHPVSIREYWDFLKAYEGLSPAARGRLADGVPPENSSPVPQDWDAMLDAALHGRLWQGRRLTEDSPVTNVSYWHALMYARHAKAKLPGADLLLAAHEAAGSYGVEEWTQDVRPASGPYAEALLVLPASKGGPTVLPESDPASLNPNRGFRVILSRNTP